MSRLSNEEMYYLYRFAKRTLEKADKCCKADHSHDPAFVSLQESIKGFDKLDLGYAERYAKEQENDPRS